MILRSRDIGSKKFGPIFFFLLMSVVYQRFHHAMQGIDRHPTKASFLAVAVARPINRMVESSFRVMRDARGQSFYLRMPYERSYEDCKRSHMQYIHELFMNNVPTKLFFDIDLKGVNMTEPEKESFLLRFYNFLVEHFNIPGFHIDPEQFIVMESLHTKEGDVKVSFHIVINNGWHFSDNVHVGRSVKNLLSRILNDDRKLRLTHEFHVDLGVYDSEHSLRCIGGSNWEDPRSIFYLKGWFALADPGDPSTLHFVNGPELANLTFAQYKSCMIMYVENDSKLVDRRQAQELVYSQSQSQSQRQFQRQEHRPGGFDLTRIDNEEHLTFLTYMLREVQKIQGNQDAIISTCIYDAEDNRYEIKFDFCHYCRYDVTQYNRMCMQARVVLDDEIVNLECHPSCRCQGQTSFIYLSDIAKQRHDFIKISLPMLARMDRDRPDMPITLDDFGRRCVDKDLLPAMRAFVYHPQRQHTGMSWDLRIWNELRRTKNYKAMVTYFNCFFAYNSQKQMVMVRTPLGYQAYAVGAKLGMLHASLVFDDPAPTKDDADATKEREFFEVWKKNKYGCHRVFAKGRMGPFIMFGTKSELAYDMNLLGPPKVNVINAFRIYRHEMEHMPATITMLRAGWNTYLDFVVMKEDDAMRQICRDWFERYMLTKLFEVGKKNYVNVFLASEDNGTGKSFPGELIICVLGEEHAMICRDMDTFKGRFIVDGNKSFILFDEAIGDANNKKTQGLFKALTTSGFFTAANKGGAEFETQRAIMDFMFTCNPEVASVFIPGVCQNFDRRNFAQELPSREEENFHLENAGRYDCQVCDGACAHSYGNLADFWSMMQQGVKPPGEDDGPLLMPLVGMLFEDYLRKRKDWSRGLEETLPVTRLVTKQQELAATPTQRWYDEKCLVRDWSVCPYADGPNMWLSAGHQLKIASFPTGQKLDEDGECKWIEWVCISTLHKQFKLDTGSQIDETTFLRQLQSFVKTRNNNKELKTKKKPCKDYEYKKYGEGLPAWYPCQIHDSNKMCIKLLKLPALPASNLLNVANRRRDYSAMRSAASFTDATMSFNGRSASQSAFTDDDNGGGGRNKRRMLDEDDPVDPHMLACMREEGGRHDNEREGVWDSSDSSSISQGENPYLDNHADEEAEQAMMEIDAEQRKRGRAGDQDAIVERLLSSPTKQQTITGLLKKRPHNPKDKEEADESSSLSLNFSE